MKLLQLLSYRAQVVKLTQHTAKLEAEIDSLKGYLAEYRQAMNTLIDTTNYLIHKEATRE